MSDTQTTTCTRKTVDRWCQPDPSGLFGEPNPTPEDPGPWKDGETVVCRCGAEVEVTHRITNQRETGTQYVGDLAAH
jgi:hypothetical protein